MDVWLKMETDYDVTQAGVLNDGGINDARLFQKAVEAVPVGGRLYFPEGRYGFSGDFTFPASITVVLAPGACLVLQGPDDRLVFDGVILAGNTQIFEGGQIVIRFCMAGNPFWFGAKGDGQTDDTAAFVAALGCFNELALPYTEQGYVLSSLCVFANMSLRSAGEKKAILKAAPGVQKLFYIGRTPPKDTVCIHPYAAGEAIGKFQISDIVFDMADAPDGSTVFFFDTASDNINTIYIRGCIFRDAYHVFEDARSKHVMMFVHFEDILCLDSRHSTFDIEDFEGFIFLKRFTIDNSRSFKKHGLTKAFPAIDIDDVRGTIFENVTVIGSNTGKPEEVGFLIPGTVALMASLWWDRVLIKDMGGYGVVFGKTVICSLIKTEILHCGGGIFAQNALELQLDQVVIDAQGVGKELGLHGVHLRQSTSCQMHDVVCRGNSGHGLLLDEVTSTFCDACTFEGNGGFGYLDQNGSQNCLMHAVCLENGQGPLQVTSAGSRVSGVTEKRGQEPVSFSSGRP